jgi:hypothetical protein
VGPLSLPGGDFKSRISGMMLMVIQQIYFNEWTTDSGSLDFLWKMHLLKGAFFLQCYNVIMKRGGAVGSTTTIDH